MPPSEKSDFYHSDGDVECQRKMCPEDFGTSVSSMKLRFLADYHVGAMVEQAMRRYLDKPLTLQSMSISSFMIWFGGMTVVTRIVPLRIPSG